MITSALARPGHCPLEYLRDVRRDVPRRELPRREACGRANSIGWLIWHLSRVIDEHLAEAAGRDEVWVAEGWSSRFGLPLDDADTGYGHTCELVAAIRVFEELLLGYADAVTDRATAYAGGLSDADLDWVVDEDWDPPVTLAVRLISVIDDAVQHVGQAGLVRGLLPGG